jgi:hypothetical protein
MQTRSNPITRIRFNFLHLDPDAARVPVKYGGVRGQSRVTGAANQTPRQGADALGHFSEVLEIGLGRAQEELVLHGAYPAALHDQRVDDRNQLPGTAVFERNDLQFGRYSKPVSNA